jgi:bifunctional non-homologous end joining protein LigD
MEITLYYKEGTSDKVYQVQKVKSGEGYLVNFQYGRRGSTFQTGTKTNHPVSNTEADTIFSKLVKSKQAKGYTEGESGTPYISTNKEERSTSLHVQLLNPISENDIEGFLKDDNYCLQEKFDGKRMLLRSLGGTVDAINRNGLVCGVSGEVSESFAQISGNNIIDGESIGDTFFAFDALVICGQNIEKLPYEERYRKLQHLIKNTTKNFVMVETGFDTISKSFMFNSIKNCGKEGVVFKDVNAPYTSGRPSSGGTQFKFKFQAEATCQVDAVHNSKRSFSVKVLDGKNGFVNVGNCAVPANKEIPKKGEIVEIRYLYAYPNGSLFQPFFKGLRDDKTSPDLYESLKFKA